VRKLAKWYRDGKNNECTDRNRDKSRQVSERHNWPSVNGDGDLESIFGGVLSPISVKTWECTG
jgi:hypothetical protein